LRIELMLESLRTTHQNEAARLRATWEDAYGPMQTMLDFQDDVPKVVAAIHAGPYKGVALTDIIGFPTDKATDVRTIAKAAAAGMRQMLDGHTDPRLLFAGAQWLHENPQAGQDANAYTFIVDQIIKKGSNQFRRRGAPVAERAAVEADLTASQDLDRQSGRELRVFLGEDAEPNGHDDTSS
jgi:hypothetical protein